MSGILELEAESVRSTEGNDTYTENTSSGETSSSDDGIFTPPTPESPPGGLFPYPARYERYPLRKAYGEQESLHSPPTSVITLSSQSASSTVIAFSDTPSSEEDSYISSEGSTPQTWKPTFNRMSAPAVFRGHPIDFKILLRSQQHRETYWGYQNRVNDLEERTAYTFGVSVDEFLEMKRQALDRDAEPGRSWER
ncbi:hypothetical protein EJ02DRAFT_422093 [Clathrospora elynae]|uniref:Uncharacterized protein n=1 Tax=Clathrospora elynae TaxID=706981 RepID=A0A6A5SPD4_9PLEO|nr:hypothetical protein EJ02DRAFT_422093 [Clathrospora elynae]